MVDRLKTLFIEENPQRGSENYREFRRFCKINPIMSYGEQEFSDEAVARIINLSDREWKEFVQTYKDLAFTKKEDRLGEEDLLKIKEIILNNVGSSTK